MKSHVSMEQKQCPVCGEIFDSGAILMDTRLVNGKLRQSLERNTVTGYGLCKEHQRLFDEGYIALVEATSNNKGNNLKPADAIRTGQICHIRRAIAHDIFDMKFPDGLPMVFVEPGVISKLQAMQEESE